MSDTYAVPNRVSEGSTSPIPTMESYRQRYLEAMNNPDRFWLGVTKDRIAWRTPPTQGLDGGYHSIADGPFSWFADGKLNITESCLDRHLETRGDKAAIIWEGMSRVTLGFLATASCMPRCVRPRTPSKGSESKRANA